MPGRFNVNQATQRAAAVAGADSYGLLLSTNSDRAAELYREGVALMLASWPGAAELLDAAILADPDFALAYAARARLYASHAHPREARNCIEVAEQKVSINGTERETFHVRVLSLAITGESNEALLRALAHTDRWPRDRVILSLLLGAFGLFAFSGMANHNLARVEICERHSAQFHTNDWWFLNHYGWSLAENGDVSRGRDMLERAFELRQKNANVVHALAHAMHESGAGNDAEALISGWLPSYDRSGILYGHIAWHAALTALERGDADGALAIYADKIQPSVSQGTPINKVSDAASLLWRVQAYGYQLPEHYWQQAADYAYRAYPQPGHNFVDPHMALIEAGGWRF